MISKYLYFGISGICKFIPNPCVMEQTVTLQPKWSPGSLIAFRFFFVYFIVYVAPFPLGFIPYAGFLLQPFHDLSFNITSALGKTFLGPEYTPLTRITGSGDAAHNYVQFFLFVGFSLVATLAWSVLDRKRDNYEKLLYWLMILLRYYLAITVLGYGFSKVFKSQFPFPSPTRLSQSYGESSPMGLLWTFMGYSTAYNIFTGLGEVVGGFLLFFRRTRLLGALLLTFVMSHIVMLNFAYDVPVKLFSLHLLAITIFLMIPDIRRLINLFLLNKTAGPEPVKPVYYDSRTRWAYMIGKTLLVLYIVIPQAMFAMKNQKDWEAYANTTKSDQLPQGEYVVETFIMNSDTVPARPDDTRRWKRMMISAKTMNVQSMDGVSIGWHFLGNTRARKLMMFSPDLSTEGNFAFKEDSTMLTMEGVLNRDSLRIISRRKSGTSFLLVDRGFHWVNEYPFNQ